MVFAISRTVVTESIVNGWLVAMFKVPITPSRVLLWIGEDGEEGEEYVCSIFPEKVISIEILLEIT